MIRADGFGLLLERARETNAGTARVAQQATARAQQKRALAPLPQILTPLAQNREIGSKREPPIQVRAILAHVVYSCNANLKDVDCVGSGPLLCALPATTLTTDADAVSYSAPEALRSEHGRLGSQHIPMPTARLARSND